MTAETATDPAGQPKGAEISAEGKMLDILYGENTASKVVAANVLVVGAGGVGCELLKNLAYNGFRKVTVIDLDTIDVSNLNRQFLFRREHVGKSKAICAAKAILEMVPAMDIQGIVANIKDTRFNVEYFKKFAVVCNALDNLEARRHVNRVCLAAKVPLIESGSTGYNGQVSVHASGFECYDCIEKKPTKSIAVCTIRSTPEKPVHCIVWAKSLWDLIFGPDDDGNLLADLDGNANGGSAEGRAEGPSAPDEVLEVKEANGNAENGTPAAQVPAKKPVKRVRYAHPEPWEDFAQRVCSRIFVDEIEEQAAMKNRWKNREPPKAFDVVKAASKSELVDLEKVNLLEQRAWNSEESARIFYSVLHHVVKNRTKEIGTISFDKDDSNALAFVVAAANLRAEAYRVKLSSPFEVKGIAGNIVHAIATTNAVVGGLVVQEALKIVINGNIEKCQAAFFTKTVMGSRVKKLVNSTKMLPAKPNCYVCSKGQLHLTVDVKRYTLKNFVEHVLKKKLSVAEPSVYVSSGTFQNLLFECGEGLEEDEIEDYAANLEKTLGELKAGDGAQLNIEDLGQNLKCDIHINHEEGCEEDKAVSEQFRLSGAKAAVAGGKENEKKVSTGVRKTDYNEVEDIDDVDLEITGACGKHFENEETKEEAEIKLKEANGTDEVKEGVAAAEANGEKKMNGVKRKEREGDGGLEEDGRGGKKLKEGV